MKQSLKHAFYFTNMLLVVIFASCSKSNNNSTATTGNNGGIISGTAYYTNYYTGNRQLLANQVVYITNSSYHKSTTTDSMGNFTFFGLDTTQLYTIYSGQFIASPAAFSIPYFGQDSNIKPTITNTNTILNDTVWYTSHLGASYSGLNMITTDSVYGKISNVRVIIYNSDTAALYDIDSMKGTGSYTHFNTDSNGKWILIFPQQLPAGSKMYANARIIFGTDTFSALTQQITFNSSFQSDTLVLKKQ